jgi:hypothetical protein
MIAGSYRVARHAGNRLAASIETKSVAAAPITSDVCGGENTTSRLRTNTAIAWIRQRSIRKSVDKTEHGRVAGNGERERNDGDGRDAFAVSQHPETKSNVLPERSHGDAPRELPPWRAVLTRF